MFSSVWLKLPPPPLCMPGSWLSKKLLGGLCKCVDTDGSVHQKKKKTELGKPSQHSITSVGMRQGDTSCSAFAFHPCDSLRWRWRREIGDDIWWTHKNRHYAEYIWEKVWERFFGMEYAGNNNKKENISLALLLSSHMEWKRMNSALVIMNKWMCLGVILISVWICLQMYASRGAFVCKFRKKKYRWKGEIRGHVSLSLS